MCIYDSCLSCYHSSLRRKWCLRSYLCLSVHHPSVCNKWFRQIIHITASKPFVVISRVLFTFTFTDSNFLSYNISVACIKTVVGVHSIVTCIYECFMLIMFMYKFMSSVYVIIFYLLCHDFSHLQQIPWAMSSAPRLSSTSFVPKYLGFNHMTPETTV